MKYLKNMQHIYAERLFGVAIGMFISAILLHNSATTFRQVVFVYTLMAASIIGSLVLGIWVYIEHYGETQDKTPKQQPKEGIDELV